jgi:NTE family protein
LAERTVKIVAVDAESGEPRDHAVGELRAGGVEVAIIAPDEASRAAIGANPLDPSTRKPVAEAGRAQGHGQLIEWLRR